MATVKLTETKYEHKKIEAKWQRRWVDTGIYSVRDDDSRPKWYELTMYPYPSGDLHIGHWYAMAPADAHARYRRMLGFNVLHPMGFDAFGLPAENAAIKRGIHPQKWTMDNISNMRRQLRSMGAIYDWDREVVTCLPDYYKWNQWFFLQLYQTGLAYRAYAPANWCPSCNTVLANEQVVEAHCERCGAEVSRRDLNQWFFRITKYAEELLDVSKIDWPDKIKHMQTNWIGRSIGVEIEFDISHLDLDQKAFETFTTRVDTRYGVTFLVMAPEHPVVSQVTQPAQRIEVERYIKQSSRMSEIERLSTEKEKTGVFTGTYCVNRLNGDKIPILVGDYVLMGYGTGVVMGVPAHDERDFEFAKKYDLPIRVVVAPPDWDGRELDKAHVDEGNLVNSGEFVGLPSHQGKERIADYIEAKNWGRRAINYRMRDWLISRQRYWGTPIPIIYCSRCGTVPVPQKDLPVVLPDDAEFRPTGESPLTSHRGFVNTSCPDCGKAAKRETDTMDTFVDSSWYFLRYISPGYSDGPFEEGAIREWAPVDQYTGGAEHAVMHLLYSRFFTRALRDLGMLQFDEPFVRLFNQGIILSDHQKMSKSRGNVISPDKYVSEMGADAVRCYLMFLGPWDQGGEWSDAGFNGVARWLNRVWDMATREKVGLNGKRVDPAAVRDLLRVVHKTTRKVTDDLEKFKFNTSLAALMELSNKMSQVWDAGNVDAETWGDTIQKLLLLLAPMAPHLTEELWELTGNEYSIHNQNWPQWDAELAADDVVTLVVQVNGKLRDRIEVPATIAENEARSLALGSERVQAHLGDREPRKIIYIPGKLINVVG